MPDASDSNPPQKPQKKRWRRRLAIAGVFVISAIFAAPYLLQTPVLLNWIIARVTAGEKVRASVGGASFGWWTPLELRDLRVESRYGEPLLHVARFRADRPWWRFALAPQRLGAFVVEAPHITLMATPTGWNFQGLSSAPKQGAGAAMPQTERKPELTADVRGAAVTLHRAGAEEPLFDVGGVDVTAVIHYVGEHRWLTVQPFQPLDHQSLTPEMCDNGLQLVAPILANASWVKGEVSLAIDELRLPLDVPRDLGDSATPGATQPTAHAAGRLSLHSVETGLKNPLLQQIADKLAGVLGAKMPTRVKLAEEAVVEFELRDRQVHHRGLAFGLPEISPSLVVRTSGSVGMDKTLDLRVDVPVMLDLALSGPLGQRLAGKSIQLSVTGTLDDPKVAFPADQGAVRQFTNLLRENPEQPTGMAANDVVDLARDVLPLARDVTQSVAENLGDALSRMRERRAERRAARLGTDGVVGESLVESAGGSAAGDALPPPPASDVRPGSPVPEQDAATPLPETSSPRRQGPLRRLFDRSRRDED